MHLKRQRVPKSWPTKKKGTKYIVRPNSNLKEGIPMLVVLRDLIKISRTRKEVKRSIYLKHILVNNKFLKDEKNSVSLFDIIGVIPSKKYYRIVLSKKGKFDFKEIKEGEANIKISRVVNKKTLKGKKTQLNLSGGINLLSKIKCNINDSILVNLKNKKIEKCLPLKENGKVLVFAGKHTGKEGVIKKINPKEKMAELEINKEKINILIKQIMVIK